MEAITLRPFEEEIIDRFKTFDPTIGGGKSRPRKGVWIKQHLLDVDEDFIYGMYERWEIFTKAAVLREALIETGDYGSFRTYIYLLKRYGLIIPTKRERAKTTSHLFFRQYYRVNIRLLNDPRWLNPYGEYPSWKRWKRKGFPRPKKKPRIPKIPAVVPPPFPWISSEEVNRIWTEAERFLREHDYTITRSDLEQIIPDWSIEAATYTTHKERVCYVVFQSVLIEEASLIARKLVDPRTVPEAVYIKIREIAEKMRKKCGATRA